MMIYLPSTELYVLSIFKFQAGTQLLLPISDMHAKQHQQTLSVHAELSQAGATLSFWHKLERQDFVAQLFW